MARDTSDFSTSFRARDLWRLPCLISWARVPLGAGFALVASRPLAAVTVLALAGLSDVLDGWIARRWGLVSAAGAILDPITDKLFVLSVATSLWANGNLTLGMIVLLGTRELAEAPLVAWYAYSPRARALRVETPMANLGGKLATLVQFGAVGWALFAQPYLELWIAASAVSGALAAAGYWRRALRGPAAAHPGPTKT